MPNQVRAIDVVGKITTRKTANFGPLDATVAERRAISPRCAGQHQGRVSLHIQDLPSDLNHVLQDRIMYQRKRSVVIIIIIIVTLQHSGMNRTREIIVHI